MMKNNYLLIVKESIVFRKDEENDVLTPYIIKFRLE